MDKEGVYELRHEGKLYRFLNRKNAEEFRRRKEKEKLKAAKVPARKKKR
jgi:ribosomal protein L24E